MRNVSRLVIMSLAGAALVGRANAQTAPPNSAQVWDIRFDVDQNGPLAAGPTATAVGIILRARVGIVPSTSYSTVNFGVSKVGGAGNPAALGATNFSMTFTDAISPPGGRGAVRQGETGSVDSLGQIINDAVGVPLAGFYPAFRGAFGPQDTGGPNNHASNGQFGINADGQPVATSMVSSRTTSNTNPGNIDPAAPGGALGAAAFDGSGFGLSNLVGEYAELYRFVYIPGSSGVSRIINVSVRNVETRYLYRSFGSGFFGHTNNNVLFTSTPLTFSFQVPSPCTGPLLALGGWAIGRRRRV